MDNVENYLEHAVDWLITFAPKLMLSIGILLIGFWLANRLRKIFRTSLEKTKVSREIITFLGSILDIGMKFVVLLVAAGTLGFEVSSLIGVLAAIGFAIGLALQGFLGNFASGITIVFFKPYKVGDWVEIAEKFGKVSSIQIFNTTIITPGQKTLIIPNGKATDETITNFSTQGHIRLELKVSMPYEESFPKVKEVILNALKDCPYILQNMELTVGIQEYESHNIILAVRPLIEPDNYWEATFEVHQRIKRAFHEHNIRMAYSEGIELGLIGE